MNLLCLILSKTPLWTANKIYFIIDLKTIKKDDFFVKDKTLRKED